MNGYVIIQKVCEHERHRFLRVAHEHEQIQFFK